MEPTTQTTIEIQTPIEIIILFDEFVKYNDTIKNPIIYYSEMYPNYFHIICTDFMFLNNTINVDIFGISKYTQNDICIFCKKI